MYNNGIRRRGSSPAIICPQCGTSFYRAPSKRAVHCSAACAITAGAHIHTTPAKVRFWQHVDKSADCWLWTGGIAYGKYGAFTVRPGEQIGAHAFAYQLASGEPIPDGMEVCHSCDVMQCVRNDESGVYTINGVARPRFGHLWIGTHAENMADRNLKRRHGHGEQHWHAKLTEDDVRSIRSRWKNGEHEVLLAAEYSMTYQNIMHIVLRRSWRHVE